MVAREDDHREIFSYHLVRVSILRSIQYIFFPPSYKRFPGLKHHEFFFTMKLGEPIFSPRRFSISTLALIAWWQDEHALDRFLDIQSNKFITKDGWHVRLKKYRFWGRVKEIGDCYTHSEQPKPNTPVVGITLARLKLSQTLRFIKWGKPVELQVRDHPGKLLGLAAMRPLNTFSTFSIWKNEAEMINMVQGALKERDGAEHRVAMQERKKKDFHHEFMTMRLIPTREVGAWSGKSNWFDGLV
ncbi:MAG: hypothetical protein NTV34_02380 [Proteobacteria bacterium]|nr:hypothetical protein [Pseudomonadota bacterium]